MAGKYRNLWYWICKNIFWIFPDTIYHNLLGFIMHKRFKCSYKWMNIKKPTTFSEKIQFLKTHPAHPDEISLADKYAVREYVSKTIGAEYLVPLVGNGVYYNANDIDFNKLPNEFVLKLTKGSGYNLICNDKSQLNIESTRKILKEWLHVQPYYMSREPQYKGKPALICEQMLEYNITDYKFFCFHGKPSYVELYIDRQGKHKKLFYDMNWQKAGFTTANDMCDYSIEKPEEFDLMIDLATKLSKDISFVRVDLYIHNSKVYFGELTFHPAGGYTPITPPEWEYKLGSLI